MLFVVLQWGTDPDGRGRSTDENEGAIVVDGANLDHGLERASWREENVADKVKMVLTSVCAIRREEVVTVNLHVRQVDGGLKLASQNLHGNHKPMNVPERVLKRNNGDYGQIAHLASRHGVCDMLNDDLGTRSNDTHFADLGGWMVAYGVFTCCSFRFPFCRLESPVLGGFGAVV